jgi:exodeoxyribonuclease X
MNGSRHIDGRRWFLDTEGNGQGIGEIVELGLVETIDLVPTGRTHRWLVRPSVKIDWKATRVHGIHNSDVEGCPTMPEIREEVISILGTTPIGGQAVHGDLDVLTRSLPGWRPEGAIDSYSIAKALLSDCESFKLSGLVDHLGLRKAVDDSVGGHAHSALNDAMATAMVVAEMRNRSDGPAFAHAFMQGQALERWDRMLEKRAAKILKQKRDREKHELRRRLRQETRSRDDAARQLGRTEKDVRAEADVEKGKAPK